MNNYLMSCKTDFWQKVFELETDFLVRELMGTHDVLSVGCGPAIIEGKLSERGFHVTGLDVSREALDCAPDRVRTVAARAEEMPFPELSFDAVIYVASLQFIEDYRKAIRKTSRVLRPAGKLIAMLLNPESVFFKEKLRDPSSYVSKIRHKNHAEIEAVIASGFSIETEYFLGVRDGTLFESRSAADAVLSVIKGIKKPISKETST